MNPDAVKVRVWDLPTRLFHWALAACVIGSVISAKIGGNTMEWHFRIGYVVLALLAFRLIWGLVGGRWSRFASFLYAPSALQRYLRGASRDAEHHEVGHSPLGALSVFALLALLLAQVSSGLFADDEIASAGPLVKFVGGATSSLLTWWHTTVGQWSIITLVLLHVAAILVYRLRLRRDLVTPMLLGDKWLPPHVPASADSLATRLLALLLLALCAAGVAALVAAAG